MLRTLARRLAPNRRLLSTAVMDIWKELIDEECSKHRRMTLTLLQNEMTSLQDRMTLLQNQIKTQQDLIKTQQDLIMSKDDVIMSKDDVIMSGKQVAAHLTLNLLKAEGLNNTRGLYEYLQDAILNKYPMTSGKKGSEAVWAIVLKNDPQLVSCLQKHLGTAPNLAAHLAATYQILSQHVHAGKHLTASSGTIYFETDFLSPEQCSSLVCLGIAAGVQVAPVPRRSAVSPPGGGGP